MNQRPQRYDQVQIGIIVTNYNSARHTAQFVEDFLAQDSSGCSLTILIADNGPAKSDLASLRELHRNNPIVHFDTMPSNLGYFGAAHSALMSAWKHGLPDWIVVSNADIRVQQPDFLQRLRRTSRGTASVIAPRIVSARTGLDQNPFSRHRPKALKIWLNRIIPRIRFLYWALEVQCSIRHAVRSLSGNKRDGKKAQTSAIYAAHGAFMIFSRGYFSSGGNINPGAFLFAEEIFIAETCRRLGISVTYDPSFEVLHDEHVSTKTSPIIRGYQAAAADYCFREFFETNAR